jgi:hypothetical protein
MKRINNIFDKICSIENLNLAEKNARKGKSKSIEIMIFDQKRDLLINELHKNLINNNFKTSNYYTFTLNEYGKERIIYKLPYYPDRIVHHAIMNVTESIWKNIFIRNTFSCIKDRGIHDALKRIKSDLKDTINTKYCLKLDIRKFYPSIDHDILKEIIMKKIKDKKTLQLIFEIIDSADGVPIGNYLSQYFANLYLSYFDHYIKETLKIKYYYRYADDMVILSSNKNELHEIFSKIKNYLDIKLKLKIKDNYQIFEVDNRGIDFLGYVIRHDYILLRKTIKKRIFKKISKPKYNIDKSIESYNGWLLYCNSYNLKNKIYLTMTKKFSELGTTMPSNIFVGDKISISKIINKDILVKSFSLSDSKFEGKKCLTIQINVDNEDRIIFTSSKNLLNQLQQVNKDDFPFEAKIEIFNKNGYMFK